VTARPAPTPGAAAPYAVAPRLALFYVAVFGTMGVSLPYWPVWLQARGLGPGEIGLLLGLGTLTKLAAEPAIGVATDRLGRRRGPMLVLAAVALFSCALFAVTDGFWAYVPLTALYLTGFTALVPLGDSLTLLHVRSGTIDYGRVRLWGSVAFIATALGAGWAIGRTGEDVVLWLLLGGLAAVVLTVATLPDRRTRPSGPRDGGARPLLTRPAFLVFLLAAAGVQSSHAVYYGFGTIEWRAAGLDETTIGLLWAEGVLAEVIVFALATRLLRDRASPATLLAIAGALTVFRWLVTGATAALPVLLLVQTLHGASFGLAYLAGMLFLTEAVPERLSATAQTLYSAGVAGLGLGVMMPAGGLLYGALGGAAYFATAGVAALGLVAALVLRRLWRRGPLPDLAG